MKKCFLLLTLSFGLCSYAFSQVTFGTKIGATFANHLTSGGAERLYSDGMRLSAYGGITVDLPLTSKFSFQPGLLLVSKGSKLDVKHSIISGNTTLTTEIKRKIAPLYLEVPLNVFYNFNLGKAKFAGGLGPYYAMGIGGKYEIMMKETKSGPGYSGSSGSGGQGRIIYGSNGDLKRHDFGLNAILSYLFDENLGIQAGYGFGLTSIYNDPLEVEDSMETKTRNSVFSIGFVYKY